MTNFHQPLYAYANAKTPEISLFSVWHFLYILLIVGGTIWAAFALVRKNEKTQDSVLKTLATLLVVTYLGDFFFHPFVYGELNVDKLPFHLCTFLCPCVAFAQFNKKFAFAKEAVAVLSIVGSLMYVTYPGSAIGDISPFHYKIVQTFLYHGLLFAWGVLSAATRRVEFNFKRVWQPLLLILLIVVWASIGNALYSNEEHHYDWFFLTGSTFPFIPAPLMPLAVIAAVFGMVNIIYGIYYGVCYVIKNKQAQQKTTA